MDMSNDYSDRDISEMKVKQDPWNKMKCILWLGVTTQMSRELSDEQGIPILLSIS